MNDILGHIRVRHTQHPSLSPVDKFNYLTSVVESTAAEAIVGLTLTAANYEEASCDPHPEIWKQATNCQSTHGDTAERGGCEFTV